jgi:ABC-type antimicrobial peptide transport system permease subunit
MSTFTQDLRYTLRQLRKSPGFTSVAVLTIALGIGANTAIFSVVNGVLLDPLPFPKANRIVVLFQDKQDFPRGSISYPNFLDWQRESRSFAAMAAYRWAAGGITGLGQPEDVRAQHVSATFFPILGVKPILGRNFSPDEDRRGANPTVMISEGLWKRKFASDPNLIGQKLIVGGESRTIIGVVPASFHFVIQNFRTADVYEPTGEETNSAFYLRDSFWGMDAIGLLQPGVTLAQVREDMKRVNAGLAAAYPDVNANIKAKIVSLKDKMVGDVELNDQMILSGNQPEAEIVSHSIASQRFSLALLGTFAGLALLLASIGIYGVLSYLVGQRTREIGVRIALEAQPLDVLRMVVGDGARLALAGTAIGRAASLGLTRLLANMLFGVRPTDPATFAGVAMALCGIALVACYLPGRRAARVDPMVALRYP